MIGLLVSVLIIAVIIGLIFMIMNMLPIPAQVKQIIWIVVVVVFAIWLISVLIPFAGGGHAFLRR